MTQRNKSKLFVCLLLYLVVSCGGNPQDDWIGKWVDENDPEVAFVFNEDGFVLIEVEINEQGIKATGTTEFATYTVDESTFVMKIVDNQITRENGIAGETVSGDWDISDRVLVLYADGGELFRLRRA